MFASINLVSSSFAWLVFGILATARATMSEGEIDQQHVGSVCPRHWVSYGESCYSFSTHLSISWQDALSRCNATTSSNLVSVNTFQEAAFLAKWLEENDLRRKGWWTSGYLVNGHWEWAGDGSKVSFYAAGARLNNVTDSKIAFMWKKEKYAWVSMKGAALLPFICELPKSKISPYVSDQPDIDYGLIGTSAILHSRGPRIIVEPSDMITYSNGPRHSVALSCKVDSYPSPTYRWIKASTGQVVEPSQSSNVIADGTLVIRNVSGKDFGAYYCEASNGLATLRTRTASFSSSYVKVFPKYRLDVYGVEGAGKSIPCESPSHFPKSQSFAWMYGTVKNFVHESDRVFISSDGTLHFSYLTEADGKNYACSVVIPELHTGYYGPFFALKVDPPAPTSSLSSKPIILDDLPHVYPDNPRVGSAAWIECFAYGRPTPVYKWTRLGGRIGEHASIQTFGHRLYFPHLYLNDSGVYRCTAENQVGVVWKDISLALQVSPKLMTPLADVVVEGDGTASFYCDVYSTPRADYEWFHNGKPLNSLLLRQEDQARIVISGNRLTVGMVRQSDAGIYQCFATNTVGQIQTSAQLVVRNVAPTFSKQLSELTVYAFVGNSARLPCQSESLPAATTTTWRHDGLTVVPGDGIRLLGNGDLMIDRVGFTHAGRYTCTVENRLGVASASVMLIFLPRLTVSVRSSQSPVEADILDFECLVNQEGNEHMDVVRKWTFNCHDINTLDKFRSINHSDRSLIGSRVSVKRDAYLEGELMCRADTVAGHASSSAKVVKKAVPMTPIKVLAHNVTLGGVHLSWVLPVRMPMISGHSNNDTAGILFKVEACLRGSDQWKQVRTVHPSEAVAAGGYLIAGQLLPYSYYQFRVTAQNPIGRSDPSASSNYIRTLPASPCRAVSSLRADVLVSGEIHVQWRPLQRIHWGSDTVGYFVEWKFANATASNLVKTSVTLRKMDVDHYVIQAAKNVFCTSYEIDVSAFNQYGRGPTASTSADPFVPAAPSSQPANVSAKVLNSSAVIIHWNRLNRGDRPCQTWIGVKVFFWPAESKRGHSFSKSFPSVKFALLNDTRAVVADLFSNTSYTFQLALFNGYGDGPRSPEVTATTSRRGPRLAPHVVAVTDDIVDGRVVAVVRWSELDGDVLGYKLLLYKSPWTVPHVIKLHRGDTVDWQPVVEIHDLKPFRQYKLCVRAFNEGSDGPFSDPVHFQLGGQSRGWSIGERSFSHWQCLLLLFTAWMHLGGTSWHAV